MRARRHKSVEEKEDGGHDLEESNYVDVLCRDEHTHKLPGRTRRHRPHGKEMQVGIQAENQKHQRKKMRATIATIFMEFSL